MVIGLKEAIEEFLERQGMNKSQVFKTTNFFIGVLEDIERQWPVNSADRWISCDDKLPKEKEYVLLYHPTRDLYKIGYLYNNRWVLSGLTVMILVNFTHWQQLPNPPIKHTEETLKQIENIYNKQ